MVISRSILRSSSLWIPKQRLTSPLPYRHFSSTRVGRATIEYHPNNGSPPPASRFRRFVSASFLVTVFAFSASFVALIPKRKLFDELTNPPNAAESLTMFEPYDEKSKEVYEYIDKHPLVLKLRADDKYTESRPHLRLARPVREHNFTAGTLMGKDKMVVPPLAFITTEDLPEIISISYIGPALCGHPGVLHGGFLATMLDEGMVRAALPVLPKPVGVTANLNVNYLVPAMANQYFVLKAKVIKVEGRKAWVEGWIETFVDESKGQKPVKLVSATTLVIQPKNLGPLSFLIPVEK